MGLAEVEWNRRASHLNTEMAETSLIGFRQKLSTTILRLQNIDFTISFFGLQKLLFRTLYIHAEVLFWAATA